MRGDIVKELNEVQLEVGRVYRNLQMLMEKEGKMLKLVEQKVMARDEAWAALCVWETLLEGDYPGATEYRNQCGVMETRDRVLEIAVDLEAVWVQFSNLVGDDWDRAFDFEFVPWFLKTCTNAATPKQDFNIAGSHLCFTGKQTAEGYKEAALKLEKLWLEDGVW